MEIDRQVLDEAVARGAISPGQAAELLDDAARRRATAAGAGSASDLPLWRPLAAALALALAASLALAVAFDRLGFLGLAAAASGLSLTMFAAGWQRFARTGGQRGQVLISAAVVVVPLAAHGLARALGQGQPFDGGPGTVLDWVAGPWFPVQASTALAAALALHTFRIPFLAAPLATAAWFAAQDAVPLLFGRGPSWTQRALVSALSGLVLLAAGVAVDKRTRDDVARWLYLPGLLAFGGALATWTGAGTFTLLVFALLNVGLVAASLLVSRRSFAVVGALGLAAAVGRLADDLLDPAALTFALAGVALAIVLLGLAYHLHQPRLEALLTARLPATVARLLPPRRG